MADNQIDVDVAINLLADVNIDLNKEDILKEFTRQQGTLLNILASAARLSPEIRTQVGIDPEVPALTPEQITAVQVKLEDQIKHLRQVLANNPRNNTKATELNLAETLSHALKLTPLSNVQGDQRKVYDSVLASIGLGPDGLSKLNQMGQADLRQVGIMAQAWAKEFERIVRTVSNPRPRTFTVETGGGEDAQVQFVRVTPERVHLPAIQALAEPVKQRANSLTQAGRLENQKKVEEQLRKQRSIEAQREYGQKVLEGLLIGDDGTLDHKKLTKTTPYNAAIYELDQKIKGLKASLGSVGVSAESPLKPEETAGHFEGIQREIQKLQETRQELVAYRGKFRGNSLAKSATVFEQEYQQAKDRAQSYFKDAKGKPIELEHHDLGPEQFRKMGLAERTAFLSDLGDAVSAIRSAKRRAGEDGSLLADYQQKELAAIALMNRYREVANELKQGPAETRRTEKRQTVSERFERQFDRLTQSDPNAPGAKRAIAGAVRYAQGNVDASPDDADLQKRLENLKNKQGSFLTGLKDAQVSARNSDLDSTITQLKAQLGNADYGSSEYKETFRTLKRLVGQRHQGSEETKIREIVKLLEASEAKTTSPLAQAQILLQQIGYLRQSSTMDNEQVKALLRRALTLAEKDTFNEAGIRLGGTIRGQITGLTANTSAQKARTLTDRITAGIPGLGAINDLQKFQISAGQLTRDVNRRYTLEQNPEAQAEALRQIAEARQKAQERFKSSSDEQKITNLNEIIKLYERLQGTLGEQASKLIREALKEQERILKARLKADPANLRHQTDLEDLLKRQHPAQEDITQSPRYLRGKQAAEAAGHDPMKIGRGYREDAILYYDNTIRQNAARAQQHDVTAQEATTLGMANEKYISNMRILKQEIAGTVGWMHKLQTSINAFFRYAVVYGAGYQVLNAITDLVGRVLELDKAFKSIQAVSQATEEQMVGVGEAIKNTATSTQFSTEQVAEAAQILAQAGVEAKDLPKVLDSVARFASATASDLTLAADVLSSLREVFTEFGDTFKDSRLADALTNAVNISKLNVQDLQVITSLGAQTAKAFGIGADQFLAAASTLANVGIRKSTVGTGLRQAMLEILNPDAQTLNFLKERYAKIGEMLSEEAIKARYQAFQTTNDPLASALTELRRIGVSGSARYDFRRVVDIRAENVLLPLMDSLETYQQNIAKIAQSGSAAKGAETQMTAFLNTWNRFGSEIDSVAHSVVDSLLPALGKFTDWMADTTHWVRSHTGADTTQEEKAKVEADLNQLESARTAYNRNEPGSQASQVSGLLETLQGSRSRLAGVLGDQATSNEEVFKLLQKLGTDAQEKNSPAQEEIFRKLESQAGRSLDESQRKTLLDISNQQVGAYQQLQGTKQSERTSLIDAMNGKATIPEMGQAVQGAFNKGNRLPDNPPRTLDDLAQQTEAILGFYDKVFSLSDMAKVKLEKQKERVTQTGARQGLGLEDLMNPEAQRLNVQNLKELGDVEGLQTLLLKVQAEQEISKKVLSHLSNPDYSKLSPAEAEANIPLLGELAKVIAEALPEAKKVAREAENQKDTAKARKQADGLTNQGLNTIEDQAGLGKQSRDLEIQRKDTERQITTLNSELQVARSQGDGKAREAELQANITQLEIALKKAEQAFSEAQLNTSVAKAQLKTEGVNPLLVQAMIQRESSNNPNAVSSAGALGLTQMLPAARVDAAKRLGESVPTEEVFRSDPAMQRRFGAAYLQQMLEQRNYRVDEALAAYNMGPGKLDEVIKEQGGFQAAMKSRPDVAGYVADIRKNYEQLLTHPRNALQKALEGSPDSADFKLATGVQRSQADISAREQSAQLEQEKAQRDVQIQELDKSIGVLGAEIEALSAAVKKSGLSRNTEEGAKNIAELEAKKNELDRLNYQRTSLSRHSATPETSDRDLRLRLDNQLAANRTEADTTRMAQARGAAEFDIRRGTQERDTLLSDIKRTSVHGDTEETSRKIDELIARNRELADAYYRRDKATESLTEKEIELNKTQLASKNSLEVYELRVKALTDALVVADRKIKETTDVPIEEQALQQYKLTKGDALSLAEKRKNLLSSQSKAEQMLAEREKAAASLQALGQEQGLSKEQQNELTRVQDEIDNFTKSIQGFQAQIDTLDTTPLQALANIKIDNIVEGLDKLSYSAKNLQHTLEDQLVSGIDGVVTGLADFVTHGQQAQQAAENLRQSMRALYDAQIQYNTVLVERPRASFEARQEANAQVLDRRRMLLSKGASTEELAADKANQENLRQSAMQNAMQAQSDREYAARQALNLAKRDERKAEWDNSILGRSVKTLGNAGQSMVESVVKSTLMSGVQKLFGLEGERGTQTNPMWVRIWGTPGAATGGAEAQSSVGSALDSLGNTAVGRSVANSYGWIKSKLGFGERANIVDNAPAAPGVSIGTAPDYAPLDATITTPGNVGDVNAQAEKNLINNTSETLNKPLTGFTEGVKGAFNYVVDGVSYVGTSLWSVGKRFADMLNGGKDEGSTILGMLSSVAGLAGSLGGMMGSFGGMSAGSGSPSLGDINAGGGSLSMDSLSRAFPSSGAMGFSFAKGGPVSGPGTATSDSIPARLSHGEYVINAASVKAFGIHNLDRINQFRFANGGFVNKHRPPSLSGFTSSSPGGYNGESPVTLAGTSIQIIDQRKAGSPDIETQRTRDTGGQEHIRMLVRDEVKSAINSGALDKTFRDNYGARRPGFHR